MSCSYEGVDVTRSEAKRAKLRSALASNRPTVAVGAHDAMTANLIENGGFDAVWVSGLGVSTMTYGLPDLNLITLTEALAAAVRIDAATSLPVIADCDNGFGSLSNLVRTVREYERSGIAAICVEDNTFPKRNSLYRGESQRELIPREEQARRIRAAKDAQETAEFFFIARVEALIAGYGVDDAYDRAMSYVEAGADALLVHSRDKTLADIEAFLERWDAAHNVPLVAVPTLFPDFTADELFERGFRLIIFANQTMRAAVQATTEVLETLRAKRNAAAVDPEIMSVDEIFRLVGTREAIELEEGSG
ncbi:MAG: isocitrate lyase/phosphoenolpyruvate mutase family protein [Gaiellaceae bacterium]